MKRILSLVALVVLTLSSCQEQKVITREIHFADPTIFVEGDTYYMSGTRNWEPLGFGLLESKDLVNWQTSKMDSLQLVLSQGDSTFGTKNFWAPQILKDNDRYYMSYTANEQTAVASSTEIAGPYTQAKVAPIDESAKNIDSFIFKDSDGKYYLYHVRFNRGNFIWVAEYDMERGEIDPQTLKLCISATDEWERTTNYISAPVAEGPTVVKIDDVYYLFYSTNHFRNIDYAVGYATSTSPYGPWVKSPNNPIIHRDIVGENGSGHGDLFVGLDNNYYYVYHVHNSKSEVNPRKCRIVPLKFTYNQERNVYDITAVADGVITPKQLIKE